MVPDESSTCRIEYRVAKRCGDRCGRRLTGTERTFMTTIDQSNVETGDVRKGQDRIARPVRARYTGTIENHFLKQCAA